MDPQFPGNSNRQREESRGERPDEKKVERVVESTVVRRKKPLGKRFAEIFFGGDSKGVLGYVASEVLLPAARDALADAITQGVERLLFGDAQSTSRRTGRRPGTTSYVNYGRYSQSTTSNPRREEPRVGHRRSRTSHDFDDIVLATRVEAETVIERLFDLIERYGQATVSDLYELVGISGNFTDEKWGWADMRGSGVRRVREGYLLDLPKTEPLD